jgi:hypothetical protein
MLFKNSVRTSKRTPHFTITKINWLMLFKEIIAVYSENHKNNKYTIQHYWLSKQVIHIVTARSLGLTETEQHESQISIEDPNEI